jgi:hypothetical protein
MGTRLELQAVLEGLQEGLNVYFQPPSNVSMTYPAIVYNRDYLEVSHADNFPYQKTTRYQLTVIDKDPDSLVPDAVASLPMTSYVRHLVVDNLNHDIYSVYY